MIILEIKTNEILDADGNPEAEWMRVGNVKSFIDNHDAEVWRERFYPTAEYRIRNEDFEL